MNISSSNASVARRTRRSSLRNYHILSITVLRADRYPGKPAYTTGNPIAPIVSIYLKRCTVKIQYSMEETIYSSKMPARRFAIALQYVPQRITYRDAEIVSAMNFSVSWVRNVLRTEIRQPCQGWEPYPSVSPGSRSSSGGSRSEVC